MLVTLLQDVGNWLRMLVTFQIFKILRVWRFLYKFVLGNKWIGLLDTIY